MKLEVFADADTVASKAAEFLAAEARRAVAARARFLAAVSGGSTPWKMLAALASLDVPWTAFHLFQIDERLAPEGDADRNLTQLRKAFGESSPLPEQNLHPMPVNDPDPERAAATYAKTLAALAGSPPVLDLAHLGMGPDGHTASLVPGDPVLTVADREVAVTQPYQGRRRMTLTYPCLDRARTVLWLITGESKATMLARLQRGDQDIPAGKVNSRHAVVFADRAAVP